MKKITIYNRDNSEGDYTSNYYLYLDRKELELLAGYNVKKQGYDLIVYYYMQGDCNLENIPAPQKGDTNAVVVSYFKNMFYSQEFLQEHKIQYALIEFHNSHVYSNIDEDISIIRELAAKIQSPLPPNVIEDLGSLVRNSSCCCVCRCK